MSRTADKRQAKALETREKALGTFSNAISEIGKANALLSEANELDGKEALSVLERKSQLEERSNVLTDRMQGRVSQIRDNNELIRRLREFTN